MSIDSILYAMTDDTEKDLTDCVKSNKAMHSRNLISELIKDGKVSDFLSQSNEDEVELCKLENLCLFHKIFERIEEMDSHSLEFIEKYADRFDPLDADRRTWLHVAVIHDRSFEVLQYLVEDRGISIEKEDEFGYTALHYYCQKEHYDPDVLKLLIKDQNDLTQPSKDGLTPLEFACSNKERLDRICSLELVNIKQLLKIIDKPSQNLINIEGYPIITSFTDDRIWLNLLQKNDKYMLLSYIKNDETFADRFYFSADTMLSIIKKCPENGQGILSFIREKFFKEDQTPKLEKILFDLTGIRAKQCKEKRVFNRSALFLAFLTGRFQLISPLLRSCQFHIVPFAMLLCLLCRNLASKQKFPDQVVKDILELKEFCEDYAIVVTNRTYNKDLSKDKMIIGDFINEPSKKLDKKSIVEVAYQAKCMKYLNLPSCKQSLTHLWNERSFRCPKIKFITHSLAHILFLLLFSYVIVNYLFATISFPESVCYVYGLGYCLEEVRQIYVTTKDDFFQSYVADASNAIDIWALLFMLVGFILRVSLRISLTYHTEDMNLFLESRHTFLFVQRLLLCLSLISFFMRVLYFASVTKILGPKLKMINTMIAKDLLPLLFIFFIFLTAFGVTFQSLLFPNSFYVKGIVTTQNVTFERKNVISLIADIFRRATFTIWDYHYTLNEAETNVSGYHADSLGQYAVYFLLLLFIVVVNVMLMNLLIALFSNTVSRIIEESKLSWNCSRYEFIQEYGDRTLLPPPLNIAFIVFEVLRYLIIKKNICKLKPKTVVNIDLEEVRSQLVPQDNESPDEASISYYIYQAFAMSGQRFRLLKDTHDLEYEKEIHFKTIEEKLERNKSEIEKIITDRCDSIEKKLNSKLLTKRFQTISSTVDLT